MAAAAAIGQLVGGGISAYGQVKQGKDAEIQGEYNYNVAQENAMLNDQQGQFAVQKQQREAAQVIGQATAQYGASGVDTGQGSALDVLQQSAAQGALDSARIKYGYDLKTRSIKQGGDVDLLKGKEALESSYYSAAGSLLGSAGKAAGSSGGGGSS